MSGRAGRCPARFRMAAAADAGRIEGFANAERRLPLSREPALSETREPVLSETREAVPSLTGDVPGHTLAGEAPTADRERGSSYLRIFKSNVFVRDHDRSLKFYVDQLGFSVVAEARFEFGRWVAIAPPDGSTILALVAPHRGTENYKLIGRHTQIAFIAEDIQATYDLWRGRGVRFLHPPQPQLWGGRLCQLLRSGRQRL